MATREKGVATTPCPNCGNDLKQVDMPDGAVGAESCTKCYSPPTKKAEKAAADTIAREKGTDTEEES